LKRKLIIIAEEIFISRFIRYFIVNISPNIIHIFTVFRYINQLERYLLRFNELIYHAYGKRLFDLPRRYDLNSDINDYIDKKLNKKVLNAHEKLWIC
jgi:hypothetical protein